jgi:hypothetical protein
LSLAEAAENAEVTEEKSKGRMEQWNHGMVGKENGVP